MTKHEWCELNPIRVWRKQNGYKQATKAAVKLGVCSVSIHGWEKGVSMPNAESLIQLSKTIPDILVKYKEWLELNPKNGIDKETV